MRLQVSIGSERLCSMFLRCKLSLNNCLPVWCFISFTDWVCVSVSVSVSVASSCFCNDFFLSFFKFMGKMLINQFKIVNCMFKWLYYKHFLLIFRHSSFFFVSLLWREKTDVVNAHLRRTLHWKLCEKNKMKTQTYRFFQVNVELWLIAFHFHSALAFLHLIPHCNSQKSFAIWIKPIQSFNNFIISLLHSMMWWIFKSIFK